MVVMRCFMSGTSLDESDDALIEIAQGELRDIMGVDAVPEFHTIHRWPAAMAQYTVGHQKRIEEVLSRLKALPGLYVIGNFLDGIGIPDCIRWGKQVAESVTRGATVRG
jgi:oxygen-dependent protoporphyrinogen oxidase